MDMTQSFLSECYVWFDGRKLESWVVILEGDVYLLYCYHDIEESKFIVYEDVQSFHFRSCMTAFPLSIYDLDKVSELLISLLERKKVTL